MDKRYAVEPVEDPVDNGAEGALGEPLRVAPGTWVKIFIFVVVAGALVLAVVSQVSARSYTPWLVNTYASVPSWVAFASLPLGVLGAFLLYRQLPKDATEDAVPASTSVWLRLALVFTCVFLLTLLYAKTSVAHYAVNNCEWPIFLGPDDVCEEIDWGRGGFGWALNLSSVGIVAFSLAAWLVGKPVRWVDGKLKKVASHQRGES